MTIRTTARIDAISTIVCDRCPRETRAHGSGRHAATMARDAVRKQAKRLGWHQVGEGDLCLNCWQQHLREQRAIEDKTNVHFHGRD